ncbi:MAG: FG-GAP-like repeat-containing protein, partial [Candidatus Cloacimonetes bacterium]|nr:FG-GAP-like repeat-containing protein [Candidatus Cloacimonadota bacterium]
MKRFVLMTLLLMIAIVWCNSVPMVENFEYSQRRDGSYSLLFDGVDDYVSIPDDEAFDFITGEDFSIFMWINAEVLQSTGDNIGMHTSLIHQTNVSGVASLKWFLFIVKESGPMAKLGFHAWNYNLTGCCNEQSEDRYITGGWHYVGIVKVGEDYQFWYDGEPAGEFTYSDQLSNPTAEVQIALANDHTEHSFQGNIDDVSIWNINLSEEEIFENMYQPQGILNQEGLVGFWQFDAILDNMAIDNSISQNNGLIHGAIQSNEIPSTVSIAAFFTAEPLSGLSPLLVNFTDHSISEEEILSWEWDFENDGVIDSYEQNPSWNYNEAGEYSVQLSISDGNNTANYIRNNYIFVDDHLGFTQVTTGNLVNDESFTHGVSWADYDNDGFQDLFIVNQENQYNYLYHNDGNGGFTQVTTGDIVNCPGYSEGIAWGDYDNDGNIDLFIADETQSNLLYHNNGGGNFTRITTGIVVNDGGQSYSASWADYDNDGYLDLFVANSNGNNFLYRNNGDSSFTKITEGEIVNDGASGGGVWADYNNDGYIDLLVPNWNRNFLYRNNGDGTFFKVTTGAIVNDVSQTYSAAWGDCNNDGFADLFVANWQQNNCLYLNNTDGSFTKVTEGIIVNEVSVSVGCSWGDYDNDGDLDLYVANADNTVWEIEPNFLYENDGYGNFTRIMSGDIVDDFCNSWQSAWADYDNDGDLDLYVGNAYNQNNLFYINNGNNNNWINIKCIGTFSNSSAIGAKVRVKANIGGIDKWQLREISGDTGHQSQSSLNAEFGLGDAAIIDSLIIEWPGGNTNVFANVEVNQFLTIMENIEFCAGFIADPVQGNAPLTVQFTDLSTSPESILSWEWDFENDGVIDSYVQNPEWIYNELGIYSVSLTINDEYGRESTTELKIDYITVNDGAPILELPDNISFFEDDSTSINVAEYITYDNMEELTISWSGNNEIDISNEGLILQISASADWFGEELVYINIDNNIFRTVVMDSMYVLVESVNDAPVIVLPDNFTFSEYGILEIDFTSYIGDVDGDDLSITASGYENVTVLIEGTNVTLGALENWTGSEILTFTVDDNQERAIASDDVEVIVTIWELAADFIAEPLIGVVPLEVQFTDLSACNPVSWEWDFDNDTVIDSYDQNPVWTYNEAGVYSVSLTVSDGDGRETSMELKIDYITVNNINHTPTIELPESFTFNTEENLIIDFSQYVLDEDGDELSIIVTGNENITVEFDSLIVTFSSEPGFVGMEILTFTVDDGISRAISSDDVEVYVLGPAVLESVITVPEVPALVDDTVLISISTTEILEEWSIISYQFELEYDTSILEYIDCDLPGTIAEGGTVLANDENGHINVAYMNTDPIAGNGAILNLEFSTINVGNSILHISNFTYNAYSIMNLNDGGVIVYSAGNHFIPVFEGNGYNNMSFNISDATIDGIDLVAMDEIAFFDGDICVGAGVLEGPIGNYIQFTASADDPTTGDIDGFIAGNEITYLIWDASEFVEISDVTPHYFAGYGDELFVEIGNAWIEELVGIGNHPPEITLPDSLAFDEDSSLFFDFSTCVNDVDGDQLQLFVTNNQYIEVTFNGLIGNISSDENWNGTETITLTVSDDQGRLTASDEMDIIVIPVNDVPVIELPDSLAFDEDGELTVDFSQYIYDIDGDDLELSVVDNLNIIVMIEEYSVTFSAGLNWNGAEEITFNATDNQIRLSSSAIVTVLVNPVNDAPTLDIPASMSFNEDEELTLDLTEYTDDVDGDELEIYILGNTMITIDITGLSVVLGTSQENWFGEEILTFTIEDNVDRLSDSAEIEIIVCPVNDVPTIDIPDSIMFGSDQSVNMDFSEYISDIEDDSLYIYHSENDYIGVNVDGYMVTFYVENNWSGREIITFTVDDLQGRAASSDNLEIIVTHFTKAYAGNGYNNMSFNIVSAIIDGIDMDFGDEIAFYDAGVCVGTGLLESPIEQSLQFTASADDPTTGEIDGFIAGNPIIYKLWSALEETEVTNVIPTYYPGYDEIFAENGIAWLDLTGLMKIEQTIELIAGWNMISFNNEPENLNMVNILQALIDEEVLIKLQDETGTSISQAPWGDWINPIGDMGITEGYCIRVGADCSLTIEGMPAELPLDIPLISGWNIISYPCIENQNALNAIQQLIDLEVLVKVQDETGASISQAPWGDWINPIGDFIPGEGYYVRVNDDALFVIDEIGEIIAGNQLPENPILSGHTIPELRDYNHFIPVYEGNGYNNMAFNIVAASINGIFLETGDEIAVFDDELCVGALILESDITGEVSDMVQFTASADDPETVDIDGFIATHTIIYKFWDASTETEISDVAVEYYSGYGDEEFTPMGTAWIENLESIQSIPVLELPDSISFLEDETTSIDLEEYITNCNLDELIISWEGNDAITIIN